MGTLVFQANLGGAVNLNGPNIASTVNFTLPSADGTNGQALVTNGTGTLSFSTVTSPPGGSTTQVQYNNAGAFAGSSNFTFNGTTVTMANDASISGLKVGKGGGAVSTNTAVGASALNANTTGSTNVAVGTSALATNTTGSSLTAVGYQALNAFNNVNGAATAFGYQAGLNYNNADAVNSSLFVGFWAGKTTSTGTDNTFVGGSAGQLNTTGGYNTTLGGASLQVNTTGSYNTAIGMQALRNNTTASNNTAVGYQAGYSNQTAYITAIGYQSLFSFNKAAAVDTHNTAVGYQVLYNCTTGIVNVGVGCYSYGGNTSTLNAVTTGSYNTAIGGGSGRGLTTGSGMTFLGYDAGNNMSTGTYGFYAGYNPTASSSSVSYEYVIGFNVAGKGASTGFISPNGGGVYQGNNSTLWSVTSDQRLKKNIVDNNDGLEKLIQVKIRNYEYRLPEEVDPELKPSDAIQKSGVQVGVIAQELQQVFPDCVKQESTGVLALHSDNLVWYMINAIKQLNAKVDAQAIEIASLKGN